MLFLQCVQFMQKQGFFEFETPILTKNTPEGAREFMVPSRIYPGSFLCIATISSII